MTAGAEGTDGTLTGVDELALKITDLENVRLNRAASTAFALSGIRSLIQGSGYSRRYLVSGSLKDFRRDTRDQPGSGSRSPPPEADRGQFDRSKFCHCGD